MNTSFIWIQRCTLNKILAYKLSPFLVWLNFKKKKEKRRKIKHHYFLPNFGVVKVNSGPSFPPSSVYAAIRTIYKVSLVKEDSVYSVCEESTFTAGRNQ